ncbi:MAG: Na+/H+ antiporter subunit E [Candidatus Omnitrophica bacterium]|nr:Na+/H+ antiporter subunit E [Candidatus Omnitrophota bacterium]
MQIRILLFIASFITWILLRWSFEAQNIVIGIAVSVLVSLMTAGIFEKKTGLLKRPWRYLWLFYYFPLFAWECFKANLEGAYRVIHPDLPIRPGIVKVKTTLKSDTGLTFLANTLTLVPGTMTVDIDRDGGFLYVHWMNVESPEIDRATVLIVERFEKVLRRIFA